MADWLSQPERGSKFLVRFIAWVSLALGRPIGRLLLYPIVGYFFLTGGVARRSSREYLNHALGRPAHWTETFKHILTFAQVTLDRVFFLTGQFNRFNVRIHGREIIDELSNEGRGCLLLGAHMGSFEALQTIGTYQRQLPIKILMYPRNSQRIMQVFWSLNPSMADQVIELGRTDTMISAKQHVERGGILGLLGDRNVAGDKLAETAILDRKAALPVGPILLASALKTPVIFFVCLYNGANRYDVYLEKLSDEVCLDRKFRNRDLQKWIDRYAERIEFYCRKSPYNWFNFYDFWNSSAQGSQNLQYLDEAKGKEKNI